jgi:hypothetical protein
MVESALKLAKEIYLGQTPDFKELAESARKSPETFAVYQEIQKEHGPIEAARYFSKVPGLFEGLAKVYDNLKPELQEIAANPYKASLGQYKRLFGGVGVAMKRSGMDYSSVCHKSCRISAPAYSQ